MGAARITGPALQALADRLRPMDTEEARQAYREGRFTRAHLVLDLNRRYRWDLFYAAQAYRVLPDDVTDAHIDTALRKIVEPL